MSGGLELILSPFIGNKKWKAWNKTREKYMPEESGQNLAETDRGWFYNQEEWLEEFLNDKGAFYDGSESDNSESDDDNYTENIEAIVRRCSSKKVFLKSSQSSQKNICVGVSFQ